MKKFFYLFALICSVCLFSACSDDDPAPDEKVNSDLVGTWNVEETQTKDEGLYDGSFKMTWTVPEGTSLTISMGGMELPMDINETIVPLASNLANTYLPQVLKSVTFGKDGSITALYKDADLGDDTYSTDATGDWKVATGYATYKVVDDTHIKLFLNTDKISAEGEDAEEKEMIKNIMKKFEAGIPVNVRWNADKSKAYFFVDKDFVQPILVSINTILSQVPSDSIDEDDRDTFEMMKNLVSQLPGVMDKTTAFEAGLQLDKQK